MAGRSVLVSADAFYQDRQLYGRHCLKIVPKNARGLIPLEYKKEQLRLLAMIDHERRRGRAPKIVVLKSRRIGASTAVEAELFRECHLRPHKRALVVAHVADSAQTIFDMSKLFYDELPEGMKPPTKYSTKRLIQFANNNSRLQVVAANEARGFTAQYLHISELAFIEDDAKLMNAILQTAPDDPESLIVAESTPNGLGNYFHTLWVNAIAGKNDWVPFFSPWFEDETYLMQPWFEAGELAPHDMKLMLDHNLSLPQMAWYISTRENKCNGDQDTMDQEYASDPASCFLASGRKVFDQGLDHYLATFEEAKAAPEGDPKALPPECEIEVDKDRPKEPKVRVVARGRWRIYREPQKRHLYIAGVDTASGDPGGDYTPIVMLNRHTMDVDAVFYGKLAPDLLAWLVAPVCEWFNQARVAGEANNQGILFFKELIDRVKYPNIYYRPVSEESVAGRISDKPGFWTSDSTRTPLFNLARRYVREHAGRCIDPNILKEWQELFYDDSNRVDHPKGGFMDATSALCLALYVHMGTFEGTLAPLPLEDRDKAVTLFRANAVRRSMGIAEEAIDLAQLTMDQIERMDRMNDARKRARERSGLANYR